MEKYDAGLALIAQAQAAEQRRSFREAHTKYLEGIEVLLRISKAEENPQTSRMVRGHIARFIEDAEKVADRKDLPTPSPAKDRAERKEAEARKFERDIRWAPAKQAFTEAAELYYAYRSAHYRLLRPADAGSHPNVLVRRAVPGPIDGVGGRTGARRT